MGGRDVAGGNVSVLRRDRLYNEAGKLASEIMARDAFVASVTETLMDYQTGLFEDALERLLANIRRDVTDKSVLAEAFNGDKPGWVEVQWAKPTGEALDKVVEWLKGHKLTLRNVPLDAAKADGPCIFTGEPAVERVLVGRSH